ncbi:ankyrin repeat-containing domain protein [Dactylonectria estremocensis]|uniref:Ankyrin repeat-containing domain protein n=1 Tax=Dactylonectria estremocensis TaxID=1079267 RepID=A0A9P9EWU7_9HYPO|nr:ankyrin repeat-containing domain protein [Dactylonectria estremocensis]
MLRRPNDLLLLIATYIESERDINMLARTNRRLFSYLDPFLYRHNVNYSHSSAFRWAATCGQERTARRAIDAGSKESDEALRLSAAHEHEEVTRILLAVEGINKNPRDYIWRIPLSHAAAEGHGSIVRLLLDTGKVDIKSRDAFDWTPLFCAVSGGHESIVKLLLDTGKVDIDSRDNSGRTPLSHAAA